MESYNPVTQKAYGNPIPYNTNPHLPYNFSSNKALCNFLQKSTEISYSAVQLLFMFKLKYSNCLGSSAFSKLRTCEVCIRSSIWFLLTDIWQSNAAIPVLPSSRGLCPYHPTIFFIGIIRLVYKRRGYPMSATTNLQTKKSITQQCYFSIKDLLLDRL